MFGSVVVVVAAAPSLLHADGEAYFEIAFPFYVECSNHKVVLIDQKRDASRRRKKSKKQNLVLIIVVGAFPRDIGPFALWQRPHPGSGKRKKSTTVVIPPLHFTPNYEYAM